MVSVRRRIEAMPKADIWRQQWDQAGIEYGLCLCGCGASTSLARSDDKRGYVKGEPMRFIHNHAHRKSPVEYVEEDCGHGTPCWVWQRAITGDGYGNLNGKRAHRVYYESARGPVPPKHDLHHECENRPCVNPDHLMAVTRSEHLRLRADTRLDRQAVGEIKAKLATRRRSIWGTGRVLAEEYGVSPSTIVAIHYGHVWADVPMATG